MQSHLQTAEHSHVLPLRSPSTDEETEAPEFELANPSSAAVKRLTGAHLLPGPTLFTLDQEPLSLCTQHQVQVMGWLLPPHLRQSPLHI